MGIPQQPGNQTRGESTAAIERATGKPWAEWVALFESHSAASLSHAEIAKIARAETPQTLHNPDWWAQAVAIAYEQAAGLRVPGQGSDGLFRVGASRTLALDRDAAIAAWVTAHGETAHHRDCAVEKSRGSRTEKRSFWRFALAGAGGVEVSATPKGDDRVTLSVSHTGLPHGEEIEEWRAHWKNLLAAL